MAFDGIVVANIIKELKSTVQGGRISKIAQPESDALLLTIKGASGQHRLLLSASASLPFVYLTATNRPSPMTAPNFCMLLRKFIANGKITDITQPGLERIIHFDIEHLDELGDLRQKRLIVELMGNTAISFSVKTADASSTASSISRHRSALCVRCSPDGTILFRTHRKNPTRSQRLRKRSCRMPATAPLHSQKHFI